MAPERPIKEGEGRSEKSEEFHPSPFSLHTFPKGIRLGWKGTPCPARGMRMDSRRRFHWLIAQAKIILILFLCYHGSACALNKSELINSTPLREVKKISNASNPSQKTAGNRASADALITAEARKADKAGPHLASLATLNTSSLFDSESNERGLSEKPSKPSIEKPSIQKPSKPSIQKPSKPSIEKPSVLKRDIVRTSNRNRTSAKKSDLTKDQPGAQTKTAESKHIPTKNYTGKPISLDFQDADIRSVLRIIGEISNHNMVIDPDVKGRVTVTLQNPVPWDHALDIILKTNQLSMSTEGNIIRVATQKTFEQEESAILKAIQAKQMTEQAKKNSRQLKTEIIPINYAQAAKLKEQVTPMLSDSKGLNESSSIIVDDRTNSLIIKDLPENLIKIKEVLANLDRETPQVMIETRIVEMNKGFLKELGVRWGGGYEKQTNYRFPRTIDITGIRGGDYAVNLPNKGDVFGGVGINLGHVNDLVRLNIELDSMESQGKGRIVSNPRIATLDNEKAEIKSGSKVPYPSIDKDGNPATNFVDAVIRLGVTPHITPNNYITMEIEADKSEPNWAKTVNGVPAITTRTATTKLIVKDGDTTVIGGLYQRAQQQNEDKVPWFGNIPGLKWLFRSHSAYEQYDELLIFITPRIVRKNESPHI